MELLKAKTRNYVLRVLVQFLERNSLSLWPYYWRSELDIPTFSTASDPELILKAGRMKSWRSPLAWEIFHREKVFVEISVSFPSSKNISSYTRGKTILTSSETQFLEQAHLLYSQQIIVFSTLNWDQVSVPSFLLYTCTLLMFTCTQDLGLLSCRCFQSVDERKILSCTLHCSVSL